MLNLGEKIRISQTHYLNKSKPWCLHRLVRHDSNSRLRHFGIERGLDAAA